MEQPETRHSIWTIGHSTHPIEEFITMIHSFGITVLADIRSYPGSRKFPHFSQDNLQKSLHENGIRYVHFAALGGRRKPRLDSENTAWRNASFKGYADYMETPSFTSSVNELEEMARQHKTCYMCSEAVWWRCHRSLLSDYLKVRGWNVMHIVAAGNASEHPYTSAARIENGKLLYREG
jgi:uncharacterized protein (DUF488 family)